MSQDFQYLTEIDDRIAAIEENLRELFEQAAVYSGAADEELASQRINDQKTELDRLLKLREEAASKET
jgi:hypothetical protein